MNGILSVGLILLAALVAGRIAQRLRVPEVTGYLLIGLIIGPAGFNVISPENRDALQFLSEVALGLILFSIGATFEWTAVRRSASTLAVVTIAETTSAFLLVLGGMLLIGLPGATALLLAVIAMETAPATTLMVLHEYDAKGPLTDLLTALLGVNNMFVLVVFGVIAATIDLVAIGGTGATVYASAYAVVWNVSGSIALGLILGLLLDAWSGRVRESGEAMILAMGIVLVAVGGARWLNLSPLFVTLAVGATMRNASERSDELVTALSHADPPLYAAFFVLAGAELRPELPATALLAVAAYIGLRTLGKVSGAILALRWTNQPPYIRRHLGFFLLSSSSLAIGLTIQIRIRFPDLAGPVTAIVLAAVLVFEIVGPLLARFALLQSGEGSVA